MFWCGQARQLLLVICRDGRDGGLSCDRLLDALAVLAGVVVPSEAILVLASAALATVLVLIVAHASPVVRVIAPSFLGQKSSGSLWGSSAAKAVGKRDIRRRGLSERISGGGCVGVFPQFLFKNNFGTCN